MEQKLYRAIETRLDSDPAFARTDIRIETILAVDWASLTFSGRRCEFDLIIGADSDDDAQRLADRAAALLDDDWQAQLDGRHILADIALDWATVEGKAAHLRFGALMIDGA